MTKQAFQLFPHSSLPYLERNTIIQLSSSSFNNFTGIILAGGKSTRMGQDKVFIPFQGVPLIERILTIITPLFAEIIIVAPQVSNFEKYPVKAVEDLYPDGGALGGLYTGLYYATNPWVFVTACDTPFLSAKLMGALMKKAEDCQVVIPRTAEGLQPLCALYHKDCLGPIKALLEQGELKIIEFFPQVKVHYFEETELAALGLSPQIFFNINTPQDLKKAESLAQKLKEQKSF